MSSEPKEYCLTDICDDVSYGYTASANEQCIGPKFLRITDIQGGLCNWNAVPYCNIDAKNKSKYNLEIGDIVIARTGNSTGENYIIQDDIDSVFASYLIRYRINKSIADPYFVWLNLRTDNWWSYVNGAKTGSAQAGANAKVLGSYPLSLPSLTRQVGISKLFKIINGKIFENTKINQTLEQMAQALFKSWFVDFEPVKAKMAVLESGGSQADAMLAAMTAISGKDADALVVFEREQPEQYAELKATAELFPSAMQESELGEIPEGWELSSLSEKIKLIGGGTPKRSEPEFWNGDICWYSVKDAPADSDVFVIDTTEKITKKGLDKSSAKLLPIGTTIISARGTVGKLALTATEMAMNQSCYGISGGEFSGPLLTYLKVKQCVDVLKRNTHGAVFDTITTSTFDTVVTLTASKIVNHRFEKIVTPLFNDIENNLRTNASLTQLRDTLLPKLLSGEITLPEAEQAVSEVENV
ncbi:restriction endonuclease subunit S [Escherichia coli]|uniref:restriction endonuclease subunit S n=1 Tax=Escherichia coli TaxID=562 RepID=UPI0019C240DE|nr:restriction endonuclease subunit S [Escherichia coli]EME2618029.1 restriction endonuclease subunit S [Escherichia coli]MDD8299026.1 restriction endonuclease subunit S [Escherichia coli]HAN4869485.1 restriction endonuclease subunit S [Escherichia coli]HCJ8824778.1 restriction endonuclease subunit S [Escherichia coli]HCP4567808.1 restriction endonuclease subunit S [Escherichia coli]